MADRPMRVVAITDTVLEELVYRAKINKPSNDWKTSEWDRMVDLVAEAMREPPRDRKEPR
jgi:hypothetical protein